MTPIEVASRVMVTLLVAGEYATIEALTGGRRLSAIELQHAVDSYGRTLARVPDEHWRLDAADTDEPDASHVIVDLWTVEEGLSDLSLELLVRDTGASPEIVVLDLHVL